MQTSIQKSIIIQKHFSGFQTTLKDKYTVMKPINCKIYQKRRCLPIDHR